MILDNINESLPLSTDSLLKIHVCRDVYVYICQPFKMSVQSLLEINPDKLFEENGIDKIKNIHVQIQNEIEKKREDLRTMVGERYRDLLKAADTITEMRHTADGVIRCINRTEIMCNMLQQKKTLEFRQIGKNVISMEDIQDISKMIEMKILLSLPEQIWVAIDNKNYLIGAELFLFAVHIHFGIEVSPNAKLIKEEFPVVSKQWELITSFRDIVINGAHSQLKIIDLLQEKVGECLTCIVLLEMVSYEILIDQYLTLRMLKLQEIMQSDDVTRNKLLLIISLIQNTLCGVNHCFLSETDDKCLIDRIIEEIVGDHAKPTLTKMAQATALPDHYLTSMVRDFHPNLNKEIKCLPKETVQKKIQSWLQRVDDFLKTELSKLLMLINDIKRLVKIRKEDVLSIQYPANWKTTVFALLNMENLNVYEYYMKNIVTKRVIQIIGTTWENCISCVMSTLKVIDDEISKERVKQLESDIRWFVWKENIMDTHDCLKLKTQGFTSRVMKLCNCVEKLLKELLSDVDLYVQESISDSKFEIRSDAVQILLYVNKCSFEMMRRLSRKVLESCTERGVCVTESGIILRARFLQSIIVHSPSFEKCLRLDYRQVLKELPENDNLNSWQDICSHLNEESSKIWQLWKELIVVKLRNLIKAKLSSKISIRTLLASKPLNDLISIEEQAEDGAKIQSNIRIPSQPSLPLQDLLFQACQILNAVIPHTLPRKIHQDVVDNFVKDILEHYEEWSRSETIYQSQAWQMLLDVRFITLLLITQENKDFSHSICEILEKIIDPFDLDVHYPHLQNNVKRSTQRLQGTVGVLINFREKLAVFNGLKLTQNTSSSKVEEPNILAMPDKIPWFALLAVPNQTSEVHTSKESTPEKIVKSKEKDPRKESKSRDFVRSANAFLNAVTSRWS